MTKIRLIRLPPVQSSRAIYGTRFTRPGFTSATPASDLSLMQMDAPELIPTGCWVRTGNPQAPEAIIHEDHIRRSRL
jgi:hypothetical protein